MFEGLITLQIENGDIKLKNHRENCPRNATYESYATVVDLLASISKIIVIFCQVSRLALFIDG